jgi:hypothetical protein
MLRADGVVESVSFDMRLIIGRTGRRQRAVVRSTSRLTDIRTSKRLV